MKRFSGTFQILGLCLLMQIACEHWPGLRDIWAFDPSRGWLGWLGAITYQFTHAGWGHFLGNFTFALPFLLYLETKLGKARLLEFYMLCGVAAALLNWLLVGGGAIGASGSLFGVFTAACLTFGDSPLEHALGIALFLTLFIQQLAMAPFSDITGVAYYGHIGGGLAAILLIQRFYRDQPKPPAQP
jgi:rhomboid family protein